MPGALPRAAKWGTPSPDNGPSATLENMAISSVLVRTANPRLNSSASPDMLPKANPTIVYSALPDGGVLFSPSQETYFGLNRTGACIWENLHPVRSSIEEVCAEVAARFPGAEPERIAQDVRKLLGMLAENGLVIPA